MISSLNRDLAFLLRGLLASVVGIVTLAGCTSIKSTFVSRSADGKFSGCCLFMPAKGVPCKFKVQTHVLVTIEETFFVDADTGEAIAPAKRILDVTVTPEYSDQMFLIHVSRPLAGTLDMSGDNKGYHFTTDGYLKKIGASIEDKTIQDVSSILGDADFKKLVKRTNVETEGGDGLSAQNRTIAEKRFNIADCNWHLEMNDWIHQYIGNCVEPCFANTSLTSGIETP